MYSAWKCSLNQIFDRNDASFLLWPTMWSMTYAAGVCLDSGAVDGLEVKRGLCNMGDAINCPGANVILGMDCM